jgi:hypothetical protein
MTSAAVLEEPYGIGTLNEHTRKALPGHAK